MLLVQQQKYIQWNKDKNITCPIKKKSLWSKIFFPFMDFDISVHSILYCFIWECTLCFHSDLFSKIRDFCVFTLSSIGCI